VFLQVLHFVAEDRQTFLFNIWQNHISGGGESPRGLRVILPRETTEETMWNVEIFCCKTRHCIFALTTYKFTNSLLSYTALTLGKTFVNEQHRHSIFFGNDIPVQTLWIRRWQFLHHCV